MKIQPLLIIPLFIIKSLLSNSNKKKYRSTPSLNRFKTSDHVFWIQYYCYANTSLIVLHVFADKYSLFNAINCILFLFSVYSLSLTAANMKIPASTQRMYTSAKIDHTKSSSSSIPDRKSKSHANSRICNVK